MQKNKRWTLNRWGLNTSLAFYRCAINADMDGTTAMTTSPNVVSRRESEGEERRKKMGRQGRCNALERRSGIQLIHLKKKKI